MEEPSQLEVICNKLGEPYFKSENCLIFNLDCVKSMRKLKNIGTDLVVTSPPYNIGKEYEDILPIKEYVSWSKKWMGRAARTLNNTGSMWLNLGYTPLQGKARALPLSYLLYDKLPRSLFFMQEIVWNYSAGVACKKMFSPRNEKLLWLVKDENNYKFNLDEVRDKNVKYPNQKKNGKLRCNPLGKNPSDVWAINKVTSGKGRSSKERTEHPAQFPEEMIERIIKVSTNEGDLVIDPFMGSGTVAAVALRLGRRVVGFEKKRKYCKIIKKRLQDYSCGITKTICKNKEA